MFTKRPTGKQRPSATSRRAVTPASPSLEAADGAQSIGALIRRARRERHQTLDDIAKLSDLSVSYLSQIERGLLQPSVATLKRIADALHIPAGKLMFTAEPRGARPTVAVMRAGQRKRVSFPESSISYELLTPDLRRRASLLWLVAQPGAQSGAALTHEGEDVVVVLKGRLSVEVGGAWHELAAGDSIYFNSELPHRWCNRTKARAEAIWVSAPPSF
ncbi:MAG TPA: XRE family transcriptional regulator [Casimicrobiaceae bacterium]|nr:XRE family transcriptional regulator [Casimicrobiaceae bacterium]